MHMLCLITYKVRSENGYGFLRPGLKTGMGNGIFWSEIGSGFGDKGGTPPPKIPRSIPPRGGGAGILERNGLHRNHWIDGLSRNKVFINLWGRDKESVFQMRKVSVRRDSTVFRWQKFKIQKL